MPRTNDLTLKEKTFIREYFKTGNATKAALVAYDTDDPNTASVIGARKLVKVRDIVQHMMMKKGLDVNWLITKVGEAGEATKWNDFTGEREEDHSIRLKAVDVAERWLGLKEESGFKIENSDVKILVMPSSMLDKYQIEHGVSPDTGNSSQEQS